MSHGADERRKANWPLMPVSGSGSIDGSQRQRHASASAAMKATMANGYRHPARLAASVASGTPARLAIVIPPIMTATAAAPWPLAARREHTIAPAPKYAPWGSPEMSREHRSMVKSTDIAARRLPRSIIAARSIMSRRSGMRWSSTSAGEPQATPAEYIEIRCPALTIDTSTPRATSPSTPIMPNSATPRANVPSASAIRALR